MKGQKSTGYKSVESRSENAQRLCRLGQGIKLGY